MIKNRMMTREAAIEALDNWEQVYEEIVDQERWTTLRWVVLKEPVDGQCWSVSYRRGLTEMQECKLWEFQKNVEFVAVELREVMVKKWCAIDREDI